MRFPIIKVRDKGGEHIVGSDCHDRLVISNGALHYLNIQYIQCMGGTEFEDGYEFVGEPEYEGDGMFGEELFVEMVSLGTLLEIAAQEDREEIRSLRTISGAGAMTIYLDIDPPRATAQQKGETICGGRIQHYTKRRVREARNLMGCGLMRQAPEEPLTGPLYLSATWVFSRACKPKARPEWKTTRPDTDNLIKLLKDVMTDCGYWKDDAQVCHEVCAKLWESAEKPRGIYIEVGRLEE